MQVAANLESGRRELVSVLAWTAWVGAVVTVIAMVPSISAFQHWMPRFPDAVHSVLGMLCGVLSPIAGIAGIAQFLVACLKGPRDHLFFNFVTFFVTVPINVAAVLMMLAFSGFTGH